MLLHKLQPKNLRSHIQTILVHLFINPLIEIKLNSFKWIDFMVCKLDLSKTDYVKEKGREHYKRLLS